MERPEEVGERDWALACEMAGLVEEAQCEFPVTGTAERPRRMAFAMLADRLAGKGMADPWRMIREAVEGMVRFGGTPQIGRLLRDVRRWPDGVYPAAGAGNGNGKGASRIEQAWRLAHGLRATTGTRGPRAIGELLGAAGRGIHHRGTEGTENSRAAAGGEMEKR